MTKHNADQYQNK